MSECRICRDHGFPGIMIAWDNNIKTKNGRFVPLELDKTTPHKHYESNPNPTTKIDSGSEVRKILNVAAIADKTTIEPYTNALTNLHEIKKELNTVSVAVDLLITKFEKYK